MISEIFIRQRNAQLIGYIVRCESEKFEQNNKTPVQILVLLVVNVVLVDIGGFKLVLG